MNIAAYPKYDSYHDSGVQWLGEIPSDWDVRRFRFLCSIGTGERNTEDKQEDGQYPFFVRSQTPERIDSYAYDGEAILTAGDGAGVGKVYHYVNGKFDFHQRVYKFSDFREVIGKYLYHYLVVNFASVALLGTAKSTVDSLRLPLIQDFPIAFPKDKISQLKIVEFLDGKCATIDEAVRIKEEQIRLLAERRQILIQQAVTRGLNKDAPMKDSGINWIGQIPAHWEVHRSKFLFTQSKELARKDDIQLSATQSYGVIPQEQFEELVGRRVVKISTNLDKRKHVELNDFVISMRSFQGGLERAYSTGCIRSSYVILRPSSQVNPDFFGYLLKTPRYIHALQITGNFIRDGQDLTFENFADVDLFVPPYEEQAEIAAHINNGCDAIDRAIALKQSQITALREYKTSLINAAVTGKIKVL